MSINFSTAFISLVSISLAMMDAHADIVYVWSGGFGSGGSIEKFDTNGVASVVATNILGSSYYPVGLALDNVGNLYAGVPSESFLYKFSPNGTAPVSAVGAIDSVSGLAYDSVGTLYVTSPNWAEIAQPVWAGRYGLPVGGLFSQAHLGYPVNLCFDSAGDIYVANGVFPFGPSPYPENTVEKFSKTLVYLGTFATNLNNPWGLAFDKAGNLYVSNSGTYGPLSNTILKFTMDGVASTFATNGLNGPSGLAFDSVGNLYVANSVSGTIEKFTSDGSGSVFASGLGLPTSIAIFPGLNLWSAKPILLKNPSRTNGVFQFNLTENPGLAFAVLATTNASLALTNWTALGRITEISTGFYQFTDQQATNGPQRFYRVVAQ